MDGSIHELTAGYALDALSPDERTSFEEHLATCADCRDELASFWEVTGSLAYAAAGPVPPPELRERLLASARAERPNVVPIRRRSWTTGAAAGAAAVAAVAAIALGLWGLSLSDDLDSTRSALDGQRAVAELLADDSARAISLEGANGKVVVGEDGRAALVVHGLEPAPSGKAYEIWVMEGQTPYRAGLFHDDGAVALDRRVPADAVVAVTLEDADGVDAPTSDPIFSAEL